MQLVKGFINVMVWAMLCAAVFGIVVELVSMNVRSAEYPIERPTGGVSRMLAMS